VAKRAQTRSSLPSKEEIRRYIEDNPEAAGKREIARAFGIKGGDRVWLKDTLRALKDEGAIEGSRRRRYTRRGGLPPYAVVEVSAIDADGEVLCRPVTWRHDEPPPPIYLAPERRGMTALAVGERVLARLERLEDGTYGGRPIRRVAAPPSEVLGVYEIGSEGGRLRPTDKRAKNEYALATHDTAGAKPGELVLAKVKAGHGRLGLAAVAVSERLGRVDSPGAFSLIAIHSNEIPTAFSPAALEQASAAGPVDPGRRRDLRRVPLVTIDGADARDFDDAVWAEPDPDKRNPGGWHVLVAIADVANYVRPGDPLDRCAYERGVSVYFPDRVVPMLPEALSNGWCSLKPGEDRGCLVAEMWLDAKGTLRRHGFCRGLMRSAARLTYEQVQAARDGDGDDVTEPLLEPVLQPLYGAFEALLAARERRGALDLDLPEMQVRVGESGTIEDIRPRERLDSHRLIEELMVTANVAAAQALEGVGQPCLYRIHESPDPAKVEALREFLGSLGIRFARGTRITPETFNRILAKAEGTPHYEMLSQLVLRTQSLAVYSPDNLGHFGLGLQRYAHFTSPIRRYADLVVHRLLVAGLGLGEGGLTAGAAADLPAWANHISMAERRAEAAERDATDRYVAAFMRERVGATFPARIVGVTRFGLFVRVLETGAEGLIPVSTLPDDRYDHDESFHALIGRRWGRTYRLGERASVRLVESSPLTGGLVFHLQEDGMAGAAGRSSRSRPQRPARKAGHKPAKRRRKRLS
jgi:ribonuclease R